MASRLKESSLVTGRSSESDSLGHWADHCFSDLDLKHILENKDHFFDETQLLSALLFVSCPS